MKKIFGLLLFVSLTISAQAPREKVLEMINVMQADKMINQIMDQMVPAMQQQFKAGLKTDDEKQKLEQVNAILLEEAKVFSKEIVNGSMVDIYAKHFDEVDIDYMIGFYKSKTGQKLLELTPTITKELMAEMMQNEMPKFQSRLKKRIDELKSSEI